MDMDHLRRGLGGLGGPVDVHLQTGVCPDQATLRVPSYRLGGTLGVQEVGVSNTQDMLFRAGLAIFIISLFENHTFAFLNFKDSILYQKNRATGVNVPH